MQHAVHTNQVFRPEQRRRRLRRPALARPPGDHRARAPLEDPAVGIDGAVDQVATSSGHRLEHLAVRLGLARIDAEGQTRGRRVDALLDHDGHAAPGRVHAQLGHVEQCCVGPERCPHDAHGVSQLGLAADTADRLVQAGEGGAGAVLVRSRRPHGEHGPRGERRECRLQRLLHTRGQGACEEEGAQAQRGVPHLFPTGFRQRFAPQLDPHSRREAVLLDESRVGRGGQAGPAWDPEAGSGELGEPRGLPPDVGQRERARTVERD